MLSNQNRCSLRRPSQLAQPLAQQLWTFVKVMKLAVSDALAVRKQKRALESQIVEDKKTDRKCAINNTKIEQTSSSWSSSPEVMMAVAYWKLQQCRFNVVIMHHHLRLQLNLKKKIFATFGGRFHF